MTFTIVVMGPTGCGKTTVATSLQRQTHWKFIESDDFHSKENKAKMASGTPLTDDDRLPWLEALYENLNHSHKASQNTKCPASNSGQ